MRKTSFGKNALCLSLIFLLPLLVYWAIPLPDPPFPDEYSAVVLDEGGQVLRVFLNGNQQWCFPPDGRQEIPEKLRKAVLCYEDRYFLYHPGVNPASLVRALFQNISAGRIVSGGSTITMQVARLMRPKRRTLGNKLLEILQALKIELRYSKGEILRMYLDHAPYGGNIIGYRIASLKYFGKNPEALTWGEAAILAVLPNAPGLVSPTIDREKLTQKRNRLLGALLEGGKIDCETYQLALLEPVPEDTLLFPIYAPHLAQSLKDRFEKNPGHAGIVRTTIIREHQQNLEEMVRQHMKHLSSRGIRNGAALVVETESGKVRAYVGSQDFFDWGSKGQVDGVQAPRSAGSILKPFLYALCIDEGLILPQTMIKDVPSNFGSFSPTNANMKFGGLVSAKEALVNSLNVPAVRLLNEYGVYKFYLFLKSAGLRTLFRPPDDYGLTLIIGGAEVNLYDLAMLYRGLGNGGRFGLLRLLEEEANGPALSQPIRRGQRWIDRPDGKGHAAARPYSRSLISPGASYLTLNMLRELKRPDAEYYWEQYQNQWPLAWKTGTSYGQRDAWAVGVSPQWTIAVWVGNFDGEGDANLRGSSCAAPLLFDIFNYLPKDPQKSWFERPTADLSPVEICLETGFLAGPDCENRVAVEAPRRMKPLKLCPYHKSIYVTSDEKHRVCSLCWEPGGYKRVTRLFYPPDVAQYLRERGQIIADIPPHKKECPGRSGHDSLQIVYPQQDARLWIPRDLDGSLQKVTLRAAHLEKGQLVYWYLDHVFKGTSRERHAMAVDLQRGWHTLEVVDEEGNRDRKRFYVDLKQ
ncbi:MAG: penicillin-binding protein 1C [bacterium]